MANVEHTTADIRAQAALLPCSPRGAAAVLRDHRPPVWSIRRTRPNPVRRSGYGVPLTVPPEAADRWVLATALCQISRALREMARWSLRQSVTGLRRGDEATAETVPNDGGETDQGWRPATPRDVDPDPPPVVLTDTLTRAANAPGLCRVAA